MLRGSNQCVITTHALVPDGRLSKLLLHETSSFMMQTVSTSSMMIKWCIQKNHKNGQQIMLGSDFKVPLHCLVCNSMMLVKWAHCLGQLPDLPVCIYSNQKKELPYLRGNKVASLLRGAVLQVCPSTPAAEVNRYSAHLLRVWACVLLNESGKSPDFIKSRVHWMGNSFRMYLCDMAIIHRQYHLQRSPVRSQHQSLPQLQVRLPLIWHCLMTFLWMRTWAYTKTKLIDHKVVFNFLWAYTCSRRCLRVY